MKKHLSNPRIHFSILFLLLVAFVSAQDSSNQRGIDSSFVSIKKSLKIDTYDYKYENALISVFKEHEGIEDIYLIEKDCPKINQKIEFREAEIQFTNEIHIWISEKKAKYPNAYITITSELNY